MIGKLAAALASVMLAGPALAASQQDWDNCQGKDPARTVAACSSIISDQNDIAQNRADAYIFRASAYLALSDFDHAIADYSEAIKLNPQNIVAYLSRAVAYFHKGDRDHAVLDYSTANALDSDATARIAANNQELEPIGAAARSSPPPPSALAAAVDGAKREAAAKQKDLADAERRFVDSFTKVHEYADPRERATAALGFAATGASNSLEMARRELRQFQSDNHLAATGYLDGATFAALIDQPVDVTKFLVRTYWDDEPAPVLIEDWFFIHEKDGRCGIWTKPIAITGKFLPHFNELPLIEVLRLADFHGDSLTQNFGVNISMRMPTMSASRGPAWLSLPTEVGLRDRCCTAAHRVALLRTMRSWRSGTCSSSASLDRRSWVAP
jgi:tetratricopeptide (TPR) repeat protein